MTGLEWLLLAALLLLHAFLVLSRSALVNARKPRLKQMGEEGSRAARTAERVAEDASRLLATTQFGITISSLFAGALVAILLAPPVTRLLQPWLGDGAYPVAFTLVVLLAAIVLLAVGQFAPETIASQQAERLALWLARPLAVLAVITLPFVHLTVWLGRLIASLFGARAPGDLSLVTEEEIKTLVDAGEEEGVIEEEEKAMIYSIFELGDTLTREVMVPRMDVVAVEAKTTILEALDRLMEAGHSRIPVYEDTIDNVIGLLYAKDLLPYLRDGRTDVPIRSILRQAYFVPETKRASDLLPDLQARRVHMAVVVDEYGGMAGLVTIEDVLEEIVGEIQDEYDVEETFIEPVGEDEFIVDARVNLDDVNQLTGGSLPTEESDTLGGFIYAELGRVPTVGDQVDHGNLTFTVESVAGRRIQKVRIRRLPLPTSAEAGGDRSAAAARNGELNGKGRHTI